MDDDKEVPIILGSQFLAICHTLMDYKDGVVSLRIEEHKMTFNVNNIMKESSHVTDVNFIDCVYNDFGSEFDDSFREECENWLQEQEEEILEAELLQFASGMPENSQERASDTYLSPRG